MTLLRQPHVSIDVLNCCLHLISCFYNYHVVGTICFVSQNRLMLSSRPAILIKILNPHHVLICDVISILFAS